MLVLVHILYHTQDTMPVALVTQTVNMPGYSSTVDLDDVQSLSRYCFPLFHFQDLSLVSVCCFYLPFTRRFLLCASSCTFPFYSCSTPRLAAIRTSPGVHLLFIDSVLDVKATMIPGWRHFFFCDPRLEQYLPEPGKERTRNLISFRSHIFFEWCSLLRMRMPKQKTCLGLCRMPTKKNLPWMLTRWMIPGNFLLEPYWIAFCVPQSAFLPWMFGSRLHNLIRKFDAW